VGAGAGPGAGVGAGVDAQGGGCVGGQHKSPIHGTQEHDAEPTGGGGGCAGRHSPIQGMHLEGAG
jgi:hypothetical protein